MKFKLTAEFSAKDVEDAKIIVIKTFGLPPELFKQVKFEKVKEKK